ncbi:MAG: anaerobic ribonucleoside-triphosphate reductase activating protein [Candidatus Woesearchaeota archaeon]|jgi:pyruvate formate lyase activating enzyme|nr:anaerobic ribonucleoside-triphosphate reductase activating protein [Candidatus Woesearchaeota archaeon]|tara:strand:+ start:531 stop:1235 length:705 start_codon:yes stop_codon:yes gene_type:complete
MTLQINGIQKTCLINYPGKVVSTLFLGGCNMQCPYCHNKDLVINPEQLEKIKENEIITFLESKKGWVDGVCISGGEPTLQKDLPKFIEKIKERGLVVKLDTNGTNPEMIKYLIDNKLTDFISMDIKAPLEKYDIVTRTKTNKKDIQESIDILRNSKIKHEFRTTVVPGLFSKEDAKEIGKWLKDCEHFTLQQFKPNKNTIDSSYNKKETFKREEMEEFKQIMQKYIKNVELKAT